MQAFPFILLSLFVIVNCLFCLHQVSHLSSSNLRSKLSLKAGCRFRLGIYLFEGQIIWRILLNLKKEITVSSLYLGIRQMCNLYFTPRDLLTYLTRPVLLVFTTFMFCDTVTWKPYSLSATIKHNWLLYVMFVHSFDLNGSTNQRLGSERKREIYNSIGKINKIEGQLYKSPIALRKISDSIQSNMSSLFIKIWNIFVN